KPARAAHHKRGTRLEYDRLEGIFSLRTADPELCRIAQRKRDNRNSRLDRFGTLVLILMKSKPRAGGIAVDQANVRLNGHSSFLRRPSGKALQIIRKLLHRKPVVI